MNKQDKFYEQFKEAAKQTEQQRFPGFEDVWQHVENRLDQKEKPKAAGFSYNRILAVAASFVALLMIGFAVYQNNKTEAPPVLVNIDSVPERVISADSITDSTPKAFQEEIAEITQKAPLPTQPKARKKRVVTETNPSNQPKATIATASNEAWIRGVVTDNNGKPVEGASIIPEGSSRALVADAKGTFFLKAKPGDLLAVEAVGFYAGKVKVSESTDVKIALNPAMHTLDEVVVVGYGTRRKSEMTGSVATVNSQQLMASNNSFHVQQQLQGSVAGVSVGDNRQNNFQLFEKRNKEKEAVTDIRIRGIGSVNTGNEPLYIINGTLSNGKALKSIAPDKIDKIDILKDASATAIYGSRAQNGVIIITTKSLTKKEQNNLRLLNDQLLNAGIKIDPVPVKPHPDYANEEYNPLVENPFTSPQVSPLSTFSIDVDNASYTNIRRYINNGEKVPQDAVRIEEMINFFKYQYAAPTGDRPFAAYTEYSDAPWNKSHKLMRIALKAKDIPLEELPPSNIVFLLDVSGSMNEPNKLPLLKSSMKVLVDQLRKEDKVSIVVYAGAAGLVLPATSGSEKATIMDALTRLDAGGSTAGGAGIELAYKTAAENFVKDGNNRVVLATDGDFNVGINSSGELQHLIEEKRKTGIFLTCLGFGMGNYKDNRLETLADKGNGNYAYIDNMQESNRFLGKEFKGTVYTLAKDVKLQIEFNPALVKSYRLIGYENRKLNDEDFVNDKIDAGEMGIGHTVTALYEIIPVGVNSSFAPAVPQLKYSNTELGKNNGQELATIKFRYKKPDADSSTESSQIVLNTLKPLQNASEDYRFAAAVAWFGLKLRNSDLIADKAMQNILTLAKGAQSYDPDGYRAECIRLMESAK